MTPRLELPIDDCITTDGYHASNDDNDNMFRKPRDNDSLGTSSQSKPSTGRPPTPPNGIGFEENPSATMNRRKASTKPLTPQANTRMNVPTPGRQATKKVAYSNKLSTKPNGSILDFFKKVDSPSIERALFISQGAALTEGQTSYTVRSPSPGSSDIAEDEDLFGDANVQENRYNESAGPLKRRRLGGGSTNKQDHVDAASEDFMAFAENVEPTKSVDGPECVRHIDGVSMSPLPPGSTTVAKSKPRRIGAFLDYSDSENEDSSFDDTGIKSEKANTKKAFSAENHERELSATLAMGPTRQGPGERDRMIVNTLGAPKNDSVLQLKNAKYPSSQDEGDLGSDEGSGFSELPKIPPLKHETTSYDNIDGFDDLEAFPDDVFPDDDEFGEEFVERKWMEEQELFEITEGARNGGCPGDGFEDRSAGKILVEEDITATCPICEGRLAGLTSDQASRHVNSCLDGNPIPIPLPVKAEPVKVKMMPSGSGSSRFSRAAVAKPGQASPFDLGNSNAASSSAFSKIMASHAEDAAWATAAAAENAARGKPAYQRTCPFYKIMPGFYVCVDAFRYGAVQGCNAYFLSHFHSDHYIGLTSTWCHGPIYCSVVTANLVKQQLRVNPKWVVALDFESRLEVPGTQGVAVTMIPANHCPGSSLFLFEKVVGRGSNPKVQRVLHCGDFRACPAHIAHPLLMPDIVDSITGKTKQQKIDVCYLDTTYLNPRYAFPSQEDVVKACADMCVSLRKVRAEENDAWEVVKKERAGAGMAKFIGASKSEDSIAMEVGSTNSRGRLLVICGTYSIGKERICMGIARALDCKIWAPPGKQRICAALEDPELMSRLTNDPKEAQIHMQMLMEIRAETLQDYLNGYKPHFSRVVGFRPSGWNYRPPNSRFVESPAVQTVLKSDNWQSSYSMAELIPQRGSTREASCFGVPYSEHSSFRELTMFCCALRIEKVIPTVNVGSAASRAKMKTWIDRWMSERRKNGLIKIGDSEGEVKW